MSDLIRPIVWFSPSNLFPPKILWNERSGFDRHWIFARHISIRPEEKWAQENLTALIFAAGVGLRRPGALFALVCGSGARQSCKGGGGCFKWADPDSWDCHLASHPSQQPGLHSLEILWRRRLITLLCSVANVAHWGGLMRRRRGDGWGAGTGRCVEPRCHTAATATTPTNLETTNHWSTNWQLSYHCPHLQVSLLNNSCQFKSLLETTQLPG